MSGAAVALSLVSDVEDQAFWYSVGVKVSMGTKFTYGTIEAPNEYKALDLLNERCEKEHGGPMCEAKIHRVNKETGEKDPDPLILMGNIMGLQHAAKQQEEVSQACDTEEPPSEEGVSEPKFGAGWGRKLPSPEPVISLAHK